MNIKPQFIEQDGKPAFVVLSIDHYNALLSESAGVSDEDFARQARAEDDGKRYPGALVDRIIQGENPLKVMREFKAMTQDELAHAANLSKNFISMLGACPRIDCSTAEAPNLAILCGPFR